MSIFFLAQPLSIFLCRIIRFWAGWISRPGRPPDSTRGSIRRRSSRRGRRWHRKRKCARRKRKRWRRPVPKGATPPHKTIPEGAIALYKAVPEEATPPHNTVPEGTISSHKAVPEGATECPSKECYTSVLNVDDQINSMSTPSVSFDTDSSTIICDNSANVHICNN